MTNSLSTKHITTPYRCKAYLKAEDFFSCKDLDPFYTATPLINKWVGLPQAFLALRESFGNNAFTKYVTHMQHLVQHHSRPIIKDNRPLQTTFPKNFHALWITKEDAPTAIHNNDLQNFLLQVKKFNDYAIVLWTNLDKNRLLELNPELRSTNVVIKNIATISTQHSKLVDFVLSPDKHLYYESIGYFKGAIIDLAKYLIMESEGGILADLNFEFYNNFETHSLTTYDFIAKGEGFTRLENYFFSAKPHHPIFEETLNIIEEMLFNPSCGNRHLKNLDATTSTITELFSMMPLAMAYLKHNNLDGNLDTLFSCRIKPNKEFSHELIEQFNAHEALAYKLNSDNSNDVADFAYSYHYLFDKLSFDYGNSPCSDLLVGKDGKDYSWF